MYELFLAFVLQLFIQLITPVKDPPKPRKYGLSEFEFPTADETRPLQIVFGTAPVSANVIATFDYLGEEVVKRQRQGLKHVNITLGYKYHIGMWLSLCLGAPTSVKKVFWGDSTAWEGDFALNSESAGEVSLFPTAPANKTLDVHYIFSSREGQEVPDGLAGKFMFLSSPTADSAAGTPLYLSQQVGASILPTYPGTTHCVFLGPTSNEPVFDENLTPEERQQLESAYQAFHMPANGNNSLFAGQFAGLSSKVQSSGFVGSSPQIPPLRFVLKRLPNVLSTMNEALSAVGGKGSGVYPFADAQSSLTTFIANNSDIDDDANGAFIIWEVLTSALNGFGIDLRPQALHLDSFLMAAEVLKNEGLGVSFVWDTTRSVNELIDDILTQINANIFIDERTGRLRLSLVRAEDPVVATFNDSNIVSFDSFSRINTNFAANEIQVSFSDKALGYEERTLTAQNLALIRQVGTTVAQEVSFIGVSNGALASFLATREIRKFSSPLANVSFTAFLPWGTVLKPGQAISVTHGELQQTLRCRVVSARFADYENRNRVQIEAVEDVFRNGNTVYDTIVSVPPSPGSNSILPLSVTNPTLTFAPYALTPMDGYDYAFYYAEPADGQTTAYQLAGQDNQTSWSVNILPAYVDERDSPAIAGTTTTALSSVTGGSTVTFALTNDMKSVFQRLALSQVETLAIIGDELMTFTGYSLTGNNVQLTGLKRGVFDTAAGFWPVGTKLTLLPGFTVYPQRLRTRKNEAGNTLDGLTSVAVRADSRGAGGVLYTIDAFASTAVLNASSSGTSRAVAPLSPGNIREGATYGSSSLNETAPNIGRGDVTINWTNRNRLESVTRSWFSNTDSNEAGTQVFYEYAYETTPGSGTFTVAQAFTAAAAGATTANIPVNGIQNQTPAGARRIRVRLQARRTDGTSTANSPIVTRYWTFTT